MTQDDAGKPVPLVRFNALLLPFPIGPLPAQVQRELRGVAMRSNWKPKAFLSGQYWFRGALLGLIPPAFCFGAVAVLFYGTGFGVSPLFLALAPVLIVPPMFLAMYIAAPLALADEVRKACADTAAQSGYCGSCGYALQQPTTPETPLRTCAECGAAWASPTQ